MDLMAIAAMIITVVVYILVIVVLASLAWWLIGEIAALFTPQSPFITKIFGFCQKLVVVAAGLALVSVLIGLIGGSLHTITFR